MDRLYKLIELQDILINKRESVIKQDYDTAAMLRDKERSIRDILGYWSLSISDLELEIKVERRDKMINEIIK